MLQKCKIFFDNRIFEHVRGGVGGRKRDGDDKISGDKTEQHEHEQLAFPARKQSFEHRDRAFAFGAFGRDFAVDRQRAEER